MPPLHRLALLVAPLLSACGFDLGGLWNLDRVSVGNVAVEDAGFFDIRGTNNKGIAPPVMLMRYWYDEAAADWVPDPTPEAVEISVDVEENPEGGVIPMTIPFPLGEEETLDVSFEIETGGGRDRVLESDALGGITIEMSR